MQLLHLLTRASLTDAEASAVQAKFNTVDNWQSLLADAELYAISGFVFKHVNEHQLEIPNNVMLALKGLAIRHQSAAKARHKTVVEITKAYADQGIKFVALKGLGLAPMIYPDVRLRAMRDIDILVPPEKKHQAGAILRDLGFDLPDEQASKYMRDSHQLPNATKKVDGYTISVEVHHDAITRDVSGHLNFDEASGQIHAIDWDGVALNVLNHELMLHQVSRHLEGVHPGGVLKLINVMDVVLYSEHFIDQIDWQVIARDYSHVINTLKCLHLIMPLSEKLQAIVGGVPSVRPKDVGVIMPALSTIINKRRKLNEVCNELFLPSDWWLHLHYNCDPSSSLLVVKLLKHPCNIAKWLFNRLVSRLLGG